MPLKTNLVNAKRKMYLIDEEEDQKRLSTNERNKKEKDFFEQKKKHEAERKAAMERVKKKQEEAEAQRKRDAKKAANNNNNKTNAGKVSNSQINKTADQRDDEEKDHYERRKQPPIVNPSIRVQERMSKINDNKEELQEDFDRRRYGYGKDDIFSPGVNENGGYQAPADLPDGIKPSITRGYTDSGTGVYPEVDIELIKSQILESYNKKIETIDQLNETFSQSASIFNETKNTYNNLSQDLLINTGLGVLSSIPVVGDVADAASIAKGTVDVINAQNLHEAAYEASNIALERSGSNLIKQVVNVLEKGAPVVSALAQAFVNEIQFIANTGSLRKVSKVMENQSISMGNLISDIQQEREKLAEIQEQADFYGVELPEPTIGD